MISFSKYSLVLRLPSKRTEYRLRSPEAALSSHVFMAWIMPGYSLPSSPGATTRVPRMERLASRRPGVLDPDGGGGKGVVVTKAMTLALGL